MKPYSCAHGVLNVKVSFNIFVTSPVSTGKKRVSLANAPLLLVPSCPSIICFSPQSLWFCAQPSQVHELAAAIRSGKFTWEELDIDDADIRLKWAGLFHRRKRFPGTFMMRLKVRKRQIKLSTKTYLAMFHLSGSWCFPLFWFFVSYVLAAKKVLRVFLFLVLLHLVPSISFILLAKTRFSIGN